MLESEVLSDWSLSIGTNDPYLGCTLGALERADFTLQLLMLVTSEKEGQMLIIFFLSIFLLAFFPTVLSKDRLSASRLWRLRPTGLEFSSFSYPDIFSF